MLKISEDSTAGKMKIIIEKKHYIYQQYTKAVYIFF